VPLSSDNCHHRYVFFLHIFPFCLGHQCSTIFLQIFFLFALAISVLPSSSRFFSFLPRPPVFYDDLPPDFFPLCLSRQCSTIFLQIFFPFCLNYKRFMRFVFIFLKKTNSFHLNHQFSMKYVLIFLHIFFPFVVFVICLCIKVFAYQRLVLAIFVIFLLVLGDGWLAQ
jgi:hypothetical protein